MSVSNAVVSFALAGAGFLALSLMAHYPPVDHEQRWHDRTRDLWIAQDLYHHALGGGRPGGWTAEQLDAMRNQVQQLEDERDGGR
jgi:Spy/CpxP family protein refolding chaperone